MSSCLMFSNLLGRSRLCTTDNVCLQAFTHGIHQIALGTRSNDWRFLSFAQLSAAWYILMSGGALLSRKLDVRCYPFAESCDPFAQDGYNCTAFLLACS